MKNYKFLKISKTKKLRYLNNNIDKDICIIFLHGFASDLEGKKPLILSKFSKKNKVGFLAVEYSGHGKSTGKFSEGNITKWTKESRELIKSKIKKNKKLIFIGSSMGSWIALNLFTYFKKQLKGFIGISSAPEFLEKLMWKKFNKKIKKILLSNKIYNLDYSGFSYPLTKQLIFDGRKNKVLNNKINLDLYLVLFHGLKDEVVPLKFSKDILKFCKKSKKKLIKIRNGDHRLSKKSDLKKICNELNCIIKNIKLT